MRDTRPISWVRAARKNFENFPEGAQRRVGLALTIAAEGRKADIAKPMKGLGAGVLEIALAHRGDAYRVVYALRIGEDIWVVHAFQKKGRKGRKTPKREIELLRDRLSRLKRELGP